MGNGATAESLIITFGEEGFFSKMDQRGMIVLAGNSQPELARAVTKQLDVRLSKTTVHHKTNRETVVDIHESVRGKDVYIIQTGSKDINNTVMEMLIMAYACKTSTARKIVGVIPYLPYSRQCKMISLSFFQSSSYY